jgi:hypothetical protein
MDVYAYRQEIKPAKGADVLGRFLDGTAAVTMNKFGEGRAVLIGALPGPAYVRPAIPMMPFGRGGTANLSTFVPTDYDPAVRGLVSDLLDVAGAKRPLVCSHPLVEAVLLRSKDGKLYHIVLVNYDTKPKPDLKVTVRGLDAAPGGETPGVSFGAKAADGTFLIRTSLDKFRVITMTRTAQ